MKCNANEKYLLEFISGLNNLKSGDFLDIVRDFGIKIKFNNINPVYKIIDELSYGQLTGK